MKRWPQKIPRIAEEAEQLAEAGALTLAIREGTGFARSYFEIMQRDAATVLAHRDMLQVMNGVKE